MNEIKCYFKKIHNLLEARFNKAYKKYGLTSTQLDVLNFPKADPSSPSTESCESICR